MMRPLMPVYPQITDGYYIRIYISSIYRKITHTFLSQTSQTSLKRTIIITRFIESGSLPSSLLLSIPDLSKQVHTRLYRSPFEAANNISIRYSRWHGTVIRQPPLTLQVSRAEDVLRRLREGWN